jgi:hypothetical protein
MLAVGDRASLTAGDYPDVFGLLLVVRPGPLRTGRATCTASGSSKPQGVCLLNWLDPLPISLFLLSAVGVHEAVCDRIVALGCIPQHGVAAECPRECAGPLTPFVWALRTVVGMQQERIAGGAAGTR